MIRSEQRLPKGVPAAGRGAARREQGRVLAMPGATEVRQGDAGACDTFPKLLLRNARVRSDRPAIREKDYGIWQTWTWAQVAAEVRAFACGLAALGFRRGDKLAVIGDNRPQLYWAMIAAQALGGVPVPLYQDSVAEEMTYILDETEAGFGVVEDQEQVDKLLEIKDRCSSLHTV